MDHLGHCDVTHWKAAAAAHGAERAEEPLVAGSPLGVQEWMARHEAGPRRAAACPRQEASDEAALQTVAPKATVLR